MIQGVGNEPRGPIKGNHKRRFIGVIPSSPAENQQVMFGQLFLTPHWVRRWTVVFYPFLGKTISVRFLRGGGVQGNHAENHHGGVQSHFQGAAHHSHRAVHEPHAATLLLSPRARWGEESNHRPGAAL